MELTYGEMRTNAEKIRDEVIKQRVLRGIELLNKHVGPDWVDHIDPMALSMSSGYYCVVGQVFQDRVPTVEEWDAYINTENGWSYVDEDREEAAPYVRGMAIIDGEAAQDPRLYGFLDDDGVNYYELDNAWLTVFGEESRA